MSSELVLHDWSASHNRPIEAICLGRAGMDLYASDFGATLATTSTYHKAVGGSPANIAFALSKLGANAAILSCVSKDGVGEFVRKAMEKQGINTDFLFTVGGEHRTSLALAEYAPKPEVVIYRNLAADLALSESHISAIDFSQIRALVVSGTALSQSPSRESCYLAMKNAAAEHCKVVLDLDYRAYSWQSAEEAASCYQKAAELSDVIIGNEEEFQVMMASDLHSKDSDAMADIANQLLAKKPEMIVAKAGEHGCKVFGLDANQSLTSFSQGIFQVEARKPYGAGDAFAGALLFGLLRGQPLEDSIALGAANAAINVMGNTCSEAMAELPELLAFMKTHRYDFSPQFSLLSHKESCHG